MRDFTTLSSSGGRALGGPARSRGTWDTSVDFWVIAAVVLTVCLLAVQTSPIYALLVGLFVFISGMTVRLLGGIQDFRGLVVLFFAMQHVIIAHIGKFFYGLPGDEYLSVPLVTMMVYVVGMASVFVAALATKASGTGKRRPLLQLNLDQALLLRVATTATVLMIIRFVILSLYGQSDTNEANVGGVVGIMHVLGFLPFTAVATGTAYVIVSSRGRASFGFWNLVPISVYVLSGLIGSSRADTMSGVITYFVTCILMRYRFKITQVLIFVVLAFFTQQVIFPFILTARYQTHTGTFSQRVSTAVDVFFQVLADPAKYREEFDDRNEKKNEAFFGKPNPTLDRYALIMPADALIRATLSQGTTGFATVLPGFAMVLPRFLYPDKPAYSTGNFLGHRAGDMIGDDDMETQIVFGYFADAFSSFGWMGVIIVPFLISFSVFKVFAFLMRTDFYGNVFYSIVGLRLAVDYAGSTMAGMIVIIGQFTVIVGIFFYVVIALFNYRTRSGGVSRTSQGRHGSSRGRPSRALPFGEGSRRRGQMVK